MLCEGTGVLSGNELVDGDCSGVVDVVMHSGIAQSGIFISTCLGAVEREVLGRKSGDEGEAVWEDRGEPLALLENEPNEPELGSESSEV